MHLEQRDSIRRHIATHTERSAEDQDAVNTLTYFLKSQGRINTSFASVDKWPNHDGTFEFVSNPDIARYPSKSFSVQIKGTHNIIERDGVISYSLKSLAYPAYIASEVTADPGILFLVFNPDIRGEERVFWKYLSPEIINNIDFEKNSCTIKFDKDDEINNTAEGIDAFCEKLDAICEMHMFLNKLDNENLCVEDALDIVQERCEEISTEIEILAANLETRDRFSKGILAKLYDLCYAVIILNAYKKGYTSVNERLAFEVAQLSVETKYLANFLKGLKYINHRIPKRGQAERLMLKYYNYLWDIRRFLRREYAVNVLENLELFPLELDTVDAEYYEKVANVIEKMDLTPRNVRVSRYYIQRSVPFFVEGQRYYEITLQLAGRYSTKFNRVTVYSRNKVSTNYSIQISYSHAEIDLWGVKNKIKILNAWKVAIDPTCLNKVAKMLLMRTKINRNYGEYDRLMNFLTETGMNLVDFMKLSSERFDEIYRNIYENSNTQDFGKVLQKVRKDYSPADGKTGKNTINYVMLTMRDEILEELFPSQYNNRCLSDELYVTSKCYPFEKNPLVSNLVKLKSSKNDIASIADIVDDSDMVGLFQPYMTIETMISDTGELLFPKNMVATDEAIKKYNNKLDGWERDNGYRIIEKNEMVCIESYYETTIYILKQLLSLSHRINREQKRQNIQYIEGLVKKLDDSVKETALKWLFVNSNVMLIYGAAGTGKTTMIKHISNIMEGYSRLYLTQTHTALQNVQRYIDNLDANCELSTIDSFVKGNSIKKYDVVFVDECSTIDNRSMQTLLEKISDDTKIVLSGDIYQIESIDFGNWFYYAKDIIKAKGANVELNHTWRTDKEGLKTLWKSVREKSPIIIEQLAMDGPFSEELGENIFHLENEEVVLCLNYDGKFGLNNMNQYFQNANTLSEAYQWEEWSFKIGDRVIFTNTKRSALLYNNLKGTIANIRYGEDKIVFTLDVSIGLTAEECRHETFTFIESNGRETRIELEILKWNDELEEDDKIKTVIPFQLAYAISIHKAQGLEYSSIKVVIPSSNAEKITHPIFYTAITRAKDNLKIYWSAETMNAIVKNFSDEKLEHRTLEIIKEELKDEI